MGCVNATYSHNIRSSPSILCKRWVAMSIVQNNWSMIAPIQQHERLLALGADAVALQTMYAEDECQASFPAVDWRNVAKRHKRRNKHETI